MEFTKQLIATLIVGLRNYQTMNALHLLPPFVEDLARDLGMQNLSNETIESLVSDLNKALLAKAGDPNSVMVKQKSSALIAVSLLHLHYSVGCQHDLDHIFEVCAELGIADIKQNRVADIFHRVCRVLKMDSVSLYKLQVTFSKHRTLQLDILMQPKMNPTEAIFYQYA